MFGMCSMKLDFTFRYFILSNHLPFIVCLLLSQL